MIWLKRASYNSRSSANNSFKPLVHCQLWHTNIRPNKFHQRTVFAANKHHHHHHHHHPHRILQLLLQRTKKRRISSAWLRTGVWRRQSFCAWMRDGDVVWCACECVRMVSASILMCHVATYIISTHISALYRLVSYLFPFRLPLFTFAIHCIWFRLVLLLCHSHTYQFIHLPNFVFVRLNECTHGACMYVWYGSKILCYHYY